MYSQKINWYPIARNLLLSEHPLQTITRIHVRPLVVCMQSACLSLLILGSIECRGTYVQSTLKTEASVKARESTYWTVSTVPALRTGGSCCWCQPEGLVQCRPWVRSGVAGKHNTMTAAACPSEGYNPLSAAACCPLNWEGFLKTLRLSDLGWTCMYSEPCLRSVR